MADPRARTLNAYLQVVEAALPYAMLLENVKGITATRSHVTQRYEALDVLRSSLRRINRRHGTSYEPIALVVDAADYGVPQRRERVFLFAARDGSGLTKPDASHGPVARAANGRAALGRYATTWDAIGELDDPDFDPALLPVGAWADLLPSIPEGANYLYHTNRGAGEPLFGWRTRYWSFLLKLAKSRPSWTLQAQAGPATGPFHWRSRRLATQKSLAFRASPTTGSSRAPSVLLAGSSGTRSRHRLASYWASPCAASCSVSARDTSHRLPRHHTMIARRRSLLALPARFLTLRGDHEDHPGPGRGRPQNRRARDRRARRGSAALSDPVRQGCFQAHGA